MRVEFEEARKFADVWLNNGVDIPLQPVHVKFATDFANVVLSSFIRQMQEQAAAARKKATEDAKPKVVLA